MTKFQSLAFDILNLGREEVLQTLECPGLPCKQYEYELQPGKVTYAPFDSDPSPGGGSNLSSVLQFVIKDGTIRVVEEQLLYDIDNFIADVGGYLGLLLGASIVSLFDAGLGLFSKYSHKIGK